jgi:hypothetical protein
MRKMIKVESGSFAALVRSYKKSLNMLAVLQHICEDNSVELSMLPDEVCELIGLEPAEREKASERTSALCGRGKRHKALLNRGYNQPEGFD